MVWEKEGGEEGEESILFTQSRRMASLYLIVPGDSSHKKLEA